MTRGQKLYTIFYQNGQNKYPIYDQNGLKIILFGAPHTYKGVAHGDGPSVALLGNYDSCASLISH